MQRKFNFRLFVWVLIVLLPVAIVVHFVHTYQVRRHASILVSRGDQALAQGNPDQALAHYANYLGFVPDDATAREKYIRLFDQVAAPGDRIRVVLRSEERRVGKE